MMDLMKTLADLIKPAAEATGGAVQGAAHGAGEAVGQAAQAGAQPLAQLAQAMPQQVAQAGGTVGMPTLSPDQAPAVTGAGGGTPAGELTPWQQRAEAAAPYVSKMGEKKQEMGPPPPLMPMQAMAQPQIVQPPAVAPYQRQGAVPPTYQRRF